jgi:hypothetical protein
MAPTADQVRGVSRRLPWLLALVLVMENLVAAMVVLHGHLPSPAVHLVGPAAGAPPVSTAAPLNTAPAVSAFVQGDLAPRVVVLEDVLAVADEQVLAELAAQVDPRANSVTLLAQAQRLQAVGEELSGVPLPVVPSDVRQHLRGLVEDLLVASQQLETLLRETAAAETQETANGPLGREGAVSVGYSQRARSVAALVGRAQDWLRTIDQETGDHVRLPSVESSTAALVAPVSLP